MATGNYNRTAERSSVTLISVHISSLFVVRYLFSKKYRSLHANANLKLCGSHMLFDTVYHEIIICFA